MLASAADPQTWIRYSYVSNNPLRFTDPTGRYAQKAGGENATFVSSGRWATPDDRGSCYGGRALRCGQEQQPQQPQQPNPHTRTNGNPADVATDDALANLFTDDGIVVGASSYRNLLKGDTHFRLADGTLHTIHIYGDSSGEHIVGAYAPKEFSQIEYVGGDDHTVTATNPQTKEVIGFAHVNVNSKEELQRNIQNTNEAGSRYLGEIGGPGSRGTGDKHVHATFFKNADSRTAAKEYKAAGAKSGRDFDSNVAQHLRNFRRLVP